MPDLSTRRRRRWMGLWMMITALIQMPFDSLAEGESPQSLSENSKGSNSQTDSEEVAGGLRGFLERVANRNGSFRPGIDRHYRGMSDSAYSDLAAVTYAVVLHRTFGWPLPYEERTVEFLL